MCPVSGLFWLSGCNTHQSALAPFGVEADALRSLLVVLLVGAVLLAAGLFWLMRRAVASPEGAITHQQGMRMVLWLGGVFPTILLGGLLIYSLPMMKPAPVGPADLRIRVDAQQFWWRTQYRTAGGPVEGANELRLPVGRTVSLELTAGDVIHSFWVPGLAGKMDMIPGRVTNLVVRAEKPGRYRGVCTEFCGLSHALMAFDVIAMPPAAFDAWLAAQARPAQAATSTGARLFAAYGCGACHSIRGTDQAGTIGPDLTHFGSRPTLGAGIRQPTIANIAGFIRHPEATKPGVRMPAFPQMREDEAIAIASYLQGLQ
ncbi:cytochrome c oxidase subunit II [uncultured Sphingomonas sp.]|uniref:cytochrome c oxidase subunit II n=1 Tax=uncultured Sphingomonas sp. TaxID=158754 RepID=UPI00261F34B8|nr:cytochrome c oxidase subunit II [uncultured Sphingomonas sp.]